MGTTSHHPVSLPMTGFKESLILAYLSTGRLSASKKEFSLCALYASVVHFKRGHPIVRSCT